MKTLPLVALSVAAALTAACATTPKNSPALDEARARIDSIAADPLAREAAGASINAAVLCCVRQIVAFLILVALFVGMIIMGQRTISWR